MVQLYSSFVYATTDALNCSKTLKRSTKKQASIVHNCDFTYPRKIFELDNIVWKSCLCRFAHPNFNELMTINKLYEKGVLPEEGGFLSQNNAMVERLEILDHLKNLHKEQQHKDQEKKRSAQPAQRPKQQKAIRRVSPPKR